MYLVHLLELPGRFANVSESAVRQIESSSPPTRALDEGYSQGAPYLVAGAGDNLFNGVYEPAGEYNGGGATACAMRACRAGAAASGLRTHSLARVGRPRP